VNIKDYISSGILEAYVLGELSELENAEVQKNLLLYPELRHELEQVEVVHERLLQAAAVNPRADLKNELLKKIDKSTGKIVEMRPAPNLNFWRFAVAASVTIALITSYLAYNYWRKWRDTADDLIAMTSQQQRMAEDYNQVNQRLDNLANDLRVLDNPEFKRVVMKGTPNAPEAMASVYWTESSQEVYLRIQNMKTLAKENQYQLWAIIDGKPVDAGVFDGTASALMKMKAIGKGATTFAVTIEPRGGKASPTLQTMQVAGNVEKG
jgi:anti-sigma-K factor RskA